MRKALSSAMFWLGASALVGVELGAPFGVIGRLDTARLPSDECRGSTTVSYVMASRSMIDTVVAAKVVSSRRCAGEAFRVELLGKSRNPLAIATGRLSSAGRAEAAFHRPLVSAAVVESVTLTMFGPSSALGGRPA